MERADFFNFKSRCLFEKSLHLCAVLTYDADIIAASFAVPFFLDIQRAKLAEAVSREKDFIECIVCNDDFRPMYHRCCHKCKLMLAEIELGAFAYNYLLFSKICAEEVFHHIESLGRGNDFCLRICLYKIVDICRVVRLHVLYYEIIRCLAAKSFAYIIEPLLFEAGIDCIHNRSFFINDCIGIICHAVWHDVLSFKKVYFMVVNADINDVVCNFHIRFPFFVLYYIIAYSAPFLQH